jgi:hypothetical protein
MTATKPSMAFHAIVKYSSFRPRRTTAARCNWTLSAHLQFTTLTNQSLPAMNAKDLVSTSSPSRRKPSHIQFFASE